MSQTNLQREAEKYLYKCDPYQLASLLRRTKLPAELVNSYSNTRAAFSALIMELRYEEESLGILVDWLKAASRNDLNGRGTLNVEHVGHPEAWVAKDLTPTQFSTAKEHVPPIKEQDFVPGKHCPKKGWVY